MGCQDGAHIEAYQRLISGISKMIKGQEVKDIINILNNAIDRRYNSISYVSTDGLSREERISSIRLQEIISSLTSYSLGDSSSLGEAIFALYLDYDKPRYDDIEVIYNTIMTLYNTGLRY